MPTRWFRLTYRAAGMSTVLLSACYSTTECDCLPLQSHVFLVGTVVDAANAPVSGARVTVHPSRAAGMPPYLTLSNDERVTDTNGEFRGIVHAEEQPQSLWLYGLVVPPGRSDTINVQGAQAVFRLKPGQPDTVRMTFKLP